MLNVYRKGFRWLFATTLMLLFCFLILPSGAEEHEDIVKVVDNDKSTKVEDVSKNSLSEEVIELEGADSSEGASGIQNPEQVYEACLSLHESFKKECTEEEIQKPLSDLVEACSDPVLNVQSVTAIASKIVSNSNDSNFSDSTECSIMVLTTSLYISSNNQVEEEEESGSLEAESLETEDSHMESELENN
ncbi:uncharacterized protein cubi_02810 [Cryptosporidium ubiquitum]|uniref:Uncharacterized protein n=1 Tax=Cryptosporidium ubiquitum TaxID=857276 RepID=A0A1J4MIG9_9CRYT|nr:uncharacterized protein cubi_02810 [Cryptosporidium ubiquitum]OII74008.1 hypothetical protein cubi_02810 [Cryptosporidium ubiquitum]